jgi:chorismate dehydratase
MITGLVAMVKAAAAGIARWGRGGSIIVAMAPKMQPAAREPSGAEVSTWRIGCVSYLNAKPLIEGLEACPAAQVTFDVPSRLFADLEGGRVDIALCPVMDYFGSGAALTIVPSGCISSEGTTLTVRLFSQEPIEQTQVVYADSDSRTSVALARVLLHEMYNLHPQMLAYEAGAPQGDRPRTMLLIGDKVVMDCPLAVQYPYQLDLGAAWHDLTGLPFVFAIWMARRETALGDLPGLLARCREENAGRTDALAERYAGAHGWPVDLARDYLGRILRYRVGYRELKAIERFGAMLARLGLIEEAAPLHVWEPPV